MTISLVLLILFPLLTEYFILGISGLPFFTGEKSKNEQKRLENNRSNNIKAVKAKANHSKVELKSSISPKSIEVNPQDRYYTTKFIFLHYHKTGHDLSQNIVKAFEHTCHGKLLHSVGSRCFGRRESNMTHVFYQDEPPFRSRLENYDLFVTQPGAYIEDWYSLLQISALNRIRVVHFIRDPYKMIMSGYLYHSENPPPSSEHWMKEKSLNYCYPIQSELERITQELGRYNGNVTYIRSLIQSSLLDCRQILSAYPKGSSYFEILKIANAKPDLFEAIKIEAYRTLFSFTGQTKATAMIGMDLLAMAVNKLREDKRFVLTMYLEDFAVADAIKFDAATSKLVDFLYPIELRTSSTSVKAGHCNVCQCTNSSALVRAIHTKAFVSESMAESSGHVTKNRMATEIKNDMILRLSKDNTLGQLLQFLAEIINKKG